MKDEKKPKIGIQGIRAAFHDAAAREYFTNLPIELVECSSFRRLAEALQGRETDFNVMAIENSLAGSILPNYQLLEKFRSQIVGEVYLRIELNLMALPGQTIEDVLVVQSHPMALLQCEDFLANFPHLQVLEGPDTAESARRIAVDQLLGHAAIAGKGAAEVYGLEILKAGIETNKLNYTRFLILAYNKEDLRDWGLPVVTPDKASLRFEIAHEPGSLLKVLKIFETHNLNMTKLQSVPVLGRPYEYSFHVDLEWLNTSDYQLALSELKANTINLIQFGDYKRSERPWL